jgi:hypothetical protein
MDTMDAVKLRITGDVSDINQKLTDVDKKMGLLNETVGNALPKGLQAMQTGLKRLGDQMVAAGASAMAAMASFGE